MRRKLINSIKYLFFGFLAFLLLALALKNQNPRELLLSLANLEMNWIYLSIILGALAIVLANRVLPSLSGINIFKADPF